MSAVLHTHPGAASDVNSRLTFQKNLQTVTNKIHATSNVDEIMLEVSADICTLFNADRLTIYTVGEDKQTIVSKVKTGLNSFKDLKLPIAEHSIAGYVGLSKRMLNLRDVYDEGELKSHNPNLRFLQEVDKRTGYRTKQMLVAPVAEPGSSELVGVVQLINNKAGVPFGQLAEEGVAELCQTLAIALKQRQKPQVLKTKYDFLVSDAVISAAEFELAARSARKKAVDVETVLIEEFQNRPECLSGAQARVSSYHSQRLQGNAQVVLRGGGRRHRRHRRYATRPRRGRGRCRGGRGRRCVRSGRQRARQAGQQNHHRCV